MTVRLRYAPSPTGHLHIGGARTALFNYLYARHCGGAFILRIEDTDIDRHVDAAAEEFAQNLRWLGIEWDEGVFQGGPHAPYSCMERLPIYARYVQELKDKGLAYECFCTEDELAEAANAQVQAGEMPHYSGRCRHLSESERDAFRAQGRTPTIRLRVPDAHTVTFTDLVRGPLSFDSRSTGGDYRIVKSNGIPVYNFAVVVDDHLMEITHVIRGEEHISNTPRQLYVYEAFGWEAPRFGHVSLILGENGKKLSKRDESIVQFIEQYKELGYLPQAIFNFLALLGWSPEGEQELLGHDELIQQFDLNRLSKSGAYFDAAKLSWMNAQYLRAHDLDDLAGLAKPYLMRCVETAPWTKADSWQRELVALYQDQLTCLSELPEAARAFLSVDVEWSSEARACLRTETGALVAGQFTEMLRQLSDPITPDSARELLKSLGQKTGTKGKDLYFPVRAIATGELHGKDLNRTLALLGHSLLYARAQAALAFVSESE
ncbi:MAG: glutamate--tRNA ligase [Firmicutes bacterium]|nr:glutamate--tRNA ligase [Bacillota bacterium]